MSERKESHQITWSGISIAITYDPQWLGKPGSGFCIAHLEVEALTPERAKLPMTETGYRSHFPDPAEIKDAGGPVAFVRAWLEHEAGSRKWKDHLETSRQGDLFD